MEAYYISDKQIRKSILNIQQYLPNVSREDIISIFAEIFQNTAVLLAFSSKQNTYRVSTYKWGEIIVVLDRYHKTIVSLSDNDAMRSKQSDKHYKDIPYLNYLLARHRDFLRLQNCEQDKPLFCLECGSSKVYLDVQTCELCCHKCNDKVPLLNYYGRQPNTASSIYETKLPAVNAIKIDHELAAYAKFTLKPQCLKLHNTCTANLWYTEDGLTIVTRTKSFRVAENEWLVSIEGSKDFLIVKDDEFQKYFKLKEAK